MKAALPEYRVRHSPRAKNLRLKVTPGEGLCVVVPSGFDPAKIPGILKRKKEWISSALAEAKKRRRFLEPKPANHLPDRLNLRAVGQQWSITYRTVSRAGLWLRCDGEALVFSGSSFPRDLVMAKLKDWLRQKVHQEIAPRAVAVAAKERFKVGKVLVKSQRTRWASCSARGNLSLNTKLLFLPPDLVHYVIVHELCHTMEMNHSKQFWRLVESHEPRFRLLDRQLRDAWKTVPQWLF